MLHEVIAESGMNLLVMNFMMHGDESSKLEMREITRKLSGPTRGA
jgi:hypothetical protein